MLGAFLKFLLISLCSFAQAQSSFHVVIKVPWNTLVHDSVYLSSPELCPDTDRCMSLQETSSFVYEGTIPQGTFQIRHGDSGSLGLDQNNQSMSIFTAGISKTPLVLSVVRWEDTPVLGIKGDVRIFSGFYSPELQNRRTISVWLPPGYDGVTDHYPVIYMHDGQNDFDPSTSTTKVDWQIDDIMTSLVASHDLPPAIVVAVDCDKAHRYDEYDYTINGARYAEFLINTVKPFIDKTFRTFTDRKNTFVMGSSMGGYISLALVWKHPEVFSKAAALSLPVAIHNSSIYQAIKNPRKPALPVQIYMDHGDYNDDGTYGIAARPFHDLLIKLGFSSEDIPYFVYPFADHREVDWARRSPVALKWLLTGS